MIGLDMIPVTVRREVNGKQGTLQFLPTTTKSEEERGISGGGGYFPGQGEQYLLAMGLAQRD